MPGNVPIFSICMPAYNPFPYLQSALDSVVSQTFADWEIVIVDDCSEREVRPELERRGVLADGRIKCIRLNENKGPFYARKVAFEACSGSYVLCLDADDEFTTSSVLEELCSLISRADVLPDVILFNATTDTSTLDSWVDYKSLGFCDGVLCRSSVIRRFLESYRLNNLWLKAIRRELLLPVNLDASAGLCMCEDRLEVAGVLAKASSFLLIDKPFYYYRQNPGSTTHRKFELGYCRQQSLVEKAVADLFSEEYDLDGLYSFFLHVWVDDMCRITWKRNAFEAAECFKAMTDDVFYREACETLGIGCLRIDRRLLLWLINKGWFTTAAIAANARRVLLGLLKGYMR